MPSVLQQKRTEASAARNSLGETPNPSPAERVESLIQLLAKSEVTARVTSRLVTLPDALSLEPSQSCLGLIGCSEGRLLELFENGAFQPDHIEDGLVYLNCSPLFVGKDSRGTEPKIFARADARSHDQIDHLLTSLRLSTIDEALRESGVDLIRAVGAIDGPALAIEAIRNAPELWEDRPSGLLAGLQPNGGIWRSCYEFQMRGIDAETLVTALLAAQKRQGFILAVASSITDHFDHSIGQAGSEFINAPNGIPSQYICGIHAAGPTEQELLRKLQRASY